MPAQSQATKPVEHPATLPAKEGQERPVRILYMEDDMGLARLFQKHLERAGFAVDVAEDGEQGLALYQEGDYDVLAIDYKMPVYDGLEVMSLLAAQGSLPPTIMLTANGDEAVAVEALKLGAGDYIVKDSAAGYIRLLPSVIERLLNAHRQEEARRRTLEALQQSERRLRAITESSSDAILNFDADGSIANWNWRAEVLFDLRKNAPTPYQITDLIPPRWHELYRRQVKDCRPGADIITGAAAVEMAARRSDDREIPVEATFTCWRDGGEVLYTAVLRDISEREQTHAALQQAARLDATTTLAKGIAHQFNNLLHGVTAHTEILLRRLEDRPDARGRLEMVLHQAERAAELVKQMLAFTQRGEYRPEVLSLNQRVRQVLQTQDTLPPKVRMERQLESKLWKVSADPTQMSQLVMNLVSNAVEALGAEGGTVTLRTANLTVGEAVPEERSLPSELAPGTYVRLTVEDDGCGMSAETLAKIYTPFFTTRFQGRGLGMAAVWGIVQHHEGHLAIDSVEGRGTRVDVYLPAVDPELRLRPEAPVRGTAPGGNETILVVDREEMFRSVTREYLELLGYRILEARNGDEAARLATEHRGDLHLALLDVDLKSPDSGHIYAQLVEARPHIRVVLCSSGEVDENVSALLEAGASGCLRKPFGLDLLGLEIRRALAE